MPAIPLPFVLSLLLLILLVGALRRDGYRFRPTTVFIAASTLLMTLVGLRWTVNAQVLRFLQPVVAATLPPLAWIAFSGLSRPSGAGIWLHSLPAVVMLGLSALWEQFSTPVDLVLALVFFGYGAALLQLARVTPDRLVHARLSDAAGARRAALVVGGLLLLSGMVDLLIAADFDLYDGRHAISIVSIANLLTLPVVAFAITVIGQSQPETSETASTGSIAGAAALQPEVTADVAPGDTESHDPQQDAATLAIVDGLMLERKLYRDPDLTLSRLARRAGLPARQISGAVNRIHGRNVSQVVNEYRVAEAMRLLRETDEPVTVVMFDSGFQTKSNFNREFARVAGMTPSDYRRSRP